MTATATVENKDATVLATAFGWVARNASVLAPRSAWNWAGARSSRLIMAALSNVLTLLDIRCPTLLCSPVNPAESRAASTRAAITAGAVSGAPR